MAGDTADVQVEDAELGVTRVWTLVIRDEKYICSAAASITSHVINYSAKL